MLANLAAVGFESSLEQWRTGLRRLEAAPPSRRGALELVTRHVEDELRRRLGGMFSAQELVSLYEEGTGWVSDLAVGVAPDDPHAWDVRIVGDAAFARYLRGAVDFAGGRLV